MRMKTYKRSRLFHEPKLLLLQNLRFLQLLLYYLGKLIFLWVLDKRPIELDELLKLAVVLSDFGATSLYILVFILYFFVQMGDLKRQIGDCGDVRLSLTRWALSLTIVNPLLQHCRRILSRHGGDRRPAWLLRRENESVTTMENQNSVEVASLMGWDGFLMEVMVGSESRVALREVRGSCLANSTRAPAQF
jgi:phage-related protein